MPPHVLIDDDASEDDASDVTLQLPPTELSGEGEVKEKEKEGMEPTHALASRCRADLATLRAAVTTAESRLASLRAEVDAKTGVAARLQHALVLRDPGSAIPTRMRAVFYLRTAETDEAVEALLPALRDARHGVLLRHEVAFCLGQMRRVIAVPTLVSILEDEADDVIVRHEAAEALGAIGLPESVRVLERFAKDERTPAEVRETCELAMERIARKETEGEGESKFESVDPAPAAPLQDKSLQALGDDMVNAKLSLYERYRAMFSLRNVAGEGDANGNANANANANADEAVRQLVRGFDDTSSALFRHEVAYVLGQIASPVSVPALERVVRNVAEHEMVRHEAAEALGAVGDEHSLAVLQQFQKDDAAIVKESCQVALDAAEYWSQFAGPRSGSTSEEDNE